MYIRGEGKTTSILGLYVNDLSCTGEDPDEIEVFKKQMTTKFEITGFGLLPFYLGIEVTQQETYITIKHLGYARKVLLQFRMSECNPIVSNGAKRMAS